jgi:hypothetical protein
LNAAARVADAEDLLTGLPRSILKNLTRSEADTVVARFEPAGAKAEVKVIPTGPDIARDWGKRRSVAEDFLFDQPVMLGSQRIGPDLADVGSRRPDRNWHLLHLYDPKVMESKSVMPPYRFLFEKRRIGREPSLDALKLSVKFAPEPGSEIVPSDQAKQLAAYLLSLRADAVIFETPMTVPPAPPALTNAPVTPTNAPAK